MLSKTRTLFAHMDSLVSKLLLALLGIMTVLGAVDMAVTRHSPLATPEDRRLAIIEQWAEAATHGQNTTIAELLRDGDNPWIAQPVIEITAGQREAGYLQQYTIEAVEHREGATAATIRWRAAGKLDTCLRIEVDSAVAVTIPFAYERCRPSLHRLD